jgi:hypothetical protein
MNTMKNDMLAGLVVLSAGVFTLGCATSSGALEQLDVSGSCDEGDAACVADGLSAPLAVGARFQLSVASQSAGSVLPTIVVESARQDVIRVEGLTLSGESEGLSAVLFVTPNDRVIDFVHVTARQPNRLALNPLDDLAGYGPIDGVVQLLVDDELAVMPTLYFADQRLMGQAEVTVEVSGDGISVLSEGLGARRRIVAREPGNASAIFTMAGLSTTLEVEVLP